MATGAMGGPNLDHTRQKFAGLTRAAARFDRKKPKPQIKPAGRENPRRGEYADEYVCRLLGWDIERIVKITAKKDRKPPE